MTRVLHRTLRRTGFAPQNTVIGVCLDLVVLIEDISAPSRRDVFGFLSSASIVPITLGTVIKRQCKGSPVEVHIQHGAAVGVHGHSLGFFQCPQIAVRPDVTHVFFGHIVQAALQCTAVRIMRMLRLAAGITGIRMSMRAGNAISLYFIFIVIVGIVRGAVRCATDLCSFQLVKLCLT